MANYSFMQNNYTTSGAYFAAPMSFCADFNIATINSTAAFAVLFLIVRNILKLRIGVLHIISNIINILKNNLSAKSLAY